MPLVETLRARLDGVSFRATRSMRPEADYMACSAARGAVVRTARRGACSCTCPLHWTDTSVRRSLQQAFQWTHFFVFAAQI